MNFPLTIMVRLTSKSSILEVTLFAELWCTNCTPLNLVFGSPKIPSNSLMELDDEETTTTDVSAAEATLKEISSLFDSSGGAPGFRRNDNLRQDLAYDVVRIPGQVTQHYTEECFEYIEVEDSAQSRRWWATEDAFSTLESTDSIDQKTTSWIWLDKEWVRY